MSEALLPEKILRELSELWVREGRAGHAETGEGVLRACAMTLIVLVERDEDTAELGETIAALMPEHPARTILVRMRRGVQQSQLEERVYSQCWTPFGSRRQICCEHIEITASDLSLGDLARLLEPLAAADLPVVLWVRCARLLELPAFRELSAVARKVIVNSAGKPAAEALPRLSALAAGPGRAEIGDLSWTLLTRWREMLASVFDNRAYQTRLAEISRISLSFAGPATPAHAWYFGAWALNALADAGIEAKLELRPDPSLKDAAVRVELGGGDFRVLLERREDRLCVEVGSLKQQMSLPRPNDYLLMREELGVIRRDPVFLRTLATAARLAEAGART